MFPDLLPIRITLRVAIAVLDSIAPFCLAYTLLSWLLYPAPPLILFHSIPLDNLFAADSYHQLFHAWCLVESLFWFLHTLSRDLVARGLWDLKGRQEVMGSEERWRLWVKMVESSKDPSSWLQGMFLAPGYKEAPLGMQDEAITKVRIEELGRDNVEEFIAHFMFGSAARLMKPASLERAELHSMVLLLELAIRNSRTSTSPPALDDTIPFRFSHGRTLHKAFLIYDEPIITSHHPFLFYFGIWIASVLGNTALYLAGFRFYGARGSWPFPLFFMRGSRSALDSLLDPPKFEVDAHLADKIGYWFHPGSKKAQAAGLQPVLFFHGISGTYGPSIFIIFLRYCTGRPFFLPEYPYVTMRLAPPSSIVTRRETIAAARKMLWRHGFTVADEGGEQEEWRKGKVILVGHSLGAGPCAWMLRDGPDIIAGSVLIDPMSVLIFAADGPRSFFRTKCRTAGEIFFRYFALEAGINHFLSRHLRWTDSVIFGPKPVSPLPPSAAAIIPRIALRPLSPPNDIPNYAPFVSPCPSGPFPSILFYSAADCILAVPKIHEYLEGSGFDGSSLRIMPDMEHAGLLIRPSWARQVASAIDEVGRAAEEVERRREAKVTVEPLLMN